MNVPSHDAEVLAEYSEKELYVILGRELSAGSSGLGDRVLDALGRAWFKENLPKLRKSICLDARVRAVRSESGQKKMTLISAVADAVAPTIDAPSAFTVAALTVSYGLDRMCADVGV